VLAGFERGDQEHKNPEDLSPVPSEPTGEKIGSIERVMIDKRSGQVAYAVLRFGGFLGIGSDYYPIPWASLNYDTSLGGYRTTITEQQLQGAPKYAGDSWDWDDRERGRRVYDYYGAPWREY
jgi:hypothetical protein